MSVKNLVLFLMVFSTVSCVTDKNEPECVNYTDCPQGFDCVDGFCIEEGTTQPDEDEKTVDETVDGMHENDDMDDLDETVDETVDGTVDETVDETVDNELPDDYVPSCGNGIVDTGEDCDDGKNDNGDGCDLDCNEESGFKCSGGPSVCAKVYINGVNLLTESATDIPICSYVKVVFSQPMKDASALANVFLENSGTKIALKKIEASGDFKEYTYYPGFNSGSIIDVNTDYSIVVGKNIEAQSGDKTSSELTYSFSTSTYDLYFETFEKTYSPWELESVWELGTPNYPYDVDNYPADKEITVGYDGSDNTLGTIMDGFYGSSVDGEEARPLHPIFIPDSGVSMTFYAHVDTEKGSPEWYDGMTIAIYQCTSENCYSNPGTDITLLEDSDNSTLMTISGYADLIGNFYITDTSNEHYGIRGKEQTDNTYQEFTVDFPDSFAGKWIIPVFKFYSDARFNHPGIYVDNISIGY